MNVLCWLWQQEIMRYRIMIICQLSLHMNKFRTSETVFKNAVKFDSDN